MIRMVPPTQPPITALEEPPEGDLHVRMKQVIWAAATVFLTAWFCTMGPIPAILALVVAKHILVAIVLMSTGVNRLTRHDRCRPHPDSTLPDGGV